MWSVWSDWLVLCDIGFSLSALRCPLSTPTVLLGLLLPWTLGISSRMLQQRMLSTEELMLLNCGVGEDPWESLACKEIKPVSCKVNQSWIFIGGTDAEAEALILWASDVKSQLIGKVLDAGKDWRQEKGTTGWDGWMTSPTWWTGVWASSRRWWRTGKPGMLQSMVSQRVAHNWVTEE